MLMHEKPCLIPIFKTQENFQNACLNVHIHNVLCFYVAVNETKLAYSYSESKKSLYSFYAVKVCLHFQLESRDLVQQVLDK